MSLAIFPDKRCKSETRAKNGVLIDDQIGAKDI